MDIKKIQTELKDRVAKGLNFGIEATEEVLRPSSPIYNDFILLKSKYNDLMHVSAMNTLPYEQIELGLDRLRNNLLRIIDQLEEGVMEREEVSSNLKVQSLPTRRTNFFKLLDIHFRNLEKIRYIVKYSEGEEEVSTGREAIAAFYRSDRHHLRHKETTEEVIEYYRDFFSSDIGTMEVYFKNIDHMLAYVLADPVEQGFFMDTLQSLFSRFELAYLFYYVLTDLDPEFSEAVRKAGLLTEKLQPILIQPTHWDYWQAR
jgi:hypothetical protein